jgi:hypothetical protein
MFVLQGVELLNALKTAHWLPYYDQSLIREVAKEMGEHFAKLVHFTNLSEQAPTEEKPKYLAAFSLFCSAFWRNRRMVLAYLKYRMDKIVAMWWQVSDAEIPEKVKDRLSVYEQKFFQNYDKIIAEYCEEINLDLTTGFFPPTSTLVPVRVLAPFDDFEGGKEYLVRPEQVERAIYEAKAVQLDF